jgi:RNA polymerase sigma-70 factor (ECF subfamily)
MPTPAETFAAAEPLRGALRLHCYRMLGSSHDSDDMVQETMLRAWRARDTLVEPARLKPWLYRIATNVCLDELARRPRRVLASDHGPPADPGARTADPIEEAVWLEPMPDTWLGDVAADPGATYALRESVALAFVAALQVLPAAQRAALLLRDVVGLSADETAEALAQSVPATESALRRARVTVEEKVARRDPASFVPSPADEEVLARYLRALVAHDIDAMIALMHDDLETTMPPSPTWIAGRAANAIFYTNMFRSFAGQDIQLRPTGANGRPAFTFHRGGVFRAVEVVEVRDGLVARVHHFMEPALLPLFAPA